MPLAVHRPDCVLSQARARRRHDGARRLVRRRRGQGKADRRQGVPFRCPGRSAVPPLRWTESVRLGGEHAGRTRESAAPRDSGVGRARRRVCLRSRPKDGDIASPSPNWSGSPKGSPVCLAARPPSGIEWLLHNSAVSLGAGGQTFVPLLAGTLLAMSDWGVRRNRTKGRHQGCRTSSSFAPTDGSGLTEELGGSSTRPSRPSVVDLLIINAMGADRTGVASEYPKRTDDVSEC